MDKKASSTMIGLFTLVGLLIVAGALLTLGMGKYLEKTHNVQLYFEKSVNGLEAGSDVRFGGVRIGRVSEISVIIDTEERRRVIPVVVELTAKDLESVGRSGEGRIDFSTKEGVDRAVQQGLRAGMKQQSLVTGQLYIEFDLAPDTKGFTFEKQVDAEYPVVPTIPTEMDEMISGITDALKKINDLDLATLLIEMRDVLKGTRTQIESLDLLEMNENITGITRDIRAITSDERIKTSLANLDQTLVEVRELSVKANTNMDPLLDDIREVAEKTRQSLVKIEAATEDISRVTNPRSPLLLDLQNALHEAEVASRTLRELSNDLKRNPGSLLRNKETR